MFFDLKSITHHVTTRTSILLEQHGNNRSRIWLNFKMNLYFVAIISAFPPSHIQCKCHWHFHGRLDSERRNKIETDVVVKCYAWYAFVAISKYKLGFNSELSRTSQLIVVFLKWKDDNQSLIDYLLGWREFQREISNGKLKFTTVYNIIATVVAPWTEAGISST